MKTTRRQLIGGAASLASLTTFDRLHAAGVPIKLGYSATVAFANAFVAADQGIFAHHGLDVDMQLVPNSSTTPAAIVAGSLQVATPTAPVTLQAIEAGLDLVVLAAGSVYQSGTGEAAVLARDGSDIQEAKDFVGKKVATPGLNAFLHILFREWMTRNGANWKRVTFVEAPFAQLGDILKAGQVDAIIIDDPFKTRALTAHDGYLVANYVAALQTDVTAGLFVAARKWADSHREQAAAFQAAMQEATALANEKPDILRKAIANFVKLPRRSLCLASKPRSRRVRSVFGQKFAWNRGCFAIQLRPIGYCGRNAARAVEQHDDVHPPTHAGIVLGCARGEAARDPAWY